MTDTKVHDGQDKVECGVVVDAACATGKQGEAIMNDNGNHKMECLGGREAGVVLPFSHRVEGKRPRARSEARREKAMLQRGREVLKAQIRA